MKRRKIVVAAGIICAVIAMVYALLSPPVFTATTTFLPQAEESQPGMMLGQLVSLAGISLDQGGAYEILYGRILLSDRLLNTVFETDWIDESNGEERPLIQILDIDGEGDELVAKAKQRLRRSVLTFARDRTTGFMRLEVSLKRRPRLAADIANHLTSALDRYLGESSRAKASEQRQFIEGRLKTVRAELTSAERDLVAFEAENRSWLSSPQQSLRHAELEREARVKSTLWIELKRQLELARIDEHKDVLRVNVLDEAVPPVEKSAPKRALIVILGGFVGFILGFLFVLVREHGATS